MAENGQYSALPDFDLSQIRASFIFMLAFWRHRGVPEPAIPLKQGLPSCSAMLPFVYGMLICLQALSHCDLSRTFDPVWHSVAPSFPSPYFTSKVKDSKHFLSLF